MPLATHQRTEEERPRLTLHCALVEDNVRYSGENGVRLHRMVVRAVNHDNTALRPGTSQTVQASFNPKEVSDKLQSYLTQYETGNDRFGDITFAGKDVSLRRDHLAVVAWVEDEVTHRVLQAAFAPVVQIQNPGKASPSRP